MIPILFSILLLLVSGLFALALGRNYRAASWCAAGGVVGASLLAVIPIGGVLLSGVTISLSMPWQMPFGSLSLHLDPVSSVFLLAIFIVSPAAAVYGIEYLRPYSRSKNVGFALFWYNVLVASMVVVCLAANGVLFLVAWEIMSLSSFFLVAFEAEKEESRQAAWTYLIATHIGTAFLLPLFIILGTCGNSFDFASMRCTFSPALATLCLILALVGFGTKAGMIPFHVWLPEAHPAAPSHVSALMSGVMIKTGIYGIIRILMMLGPPPLWWGWLFIGLGVVSGLLGVLFALAQHDIKRLLAYHSVENIGIIIIGIGVGLTGMAEGNSFVATLGFCGALLHVVNHALFKGLLFLGAGSIYHATGTREIDKLGGLIKRMPLTAVTFLVGAVAISGLPPLNGFVSEFLIYCAAFIGVLHLGTGTTMALTASIVGLGLIGGLATACFTKAFGIPFLGRPRSKFVDVPHESNRFMTIPMVFLALLCVLIGISGPSAVAGLSAATNELVGTGCGVELLTAMRYLVWICIGTVVLLAFSGVLLGLRALLLSGRDVRSAETWGCGYLDPKPRMQYTASSFARPITGLFRFVLRTKDIGTRVAGYFPPKAELETETLDAGREHVYRPLFTMVNNILGWMQVLQHGRTQLYVLYIVLALIATLIWKLR